MCPARRRTRKRGRHTGDDKRMKIPARNWLEGPPAFKASYLRGIVAAKEGKRRRDCPYEDLAGHAAQQHAKAWLAGYDSVEKARVKV